jgi:hypothetical protein
MGYGLLMGLGQGISSLGNTAQSYWDNTKKAEAQKSALETEALRRSLLEEQILDNQQLRPLNMKHVQMQIDQGQSAIDENKAQIKSAELKDLMSKLDAFRGTDSVAGSALQTEAGAANLGGLFNAEGKISVDPLMALKMDAERARIMSERAQAGASGAQAQYYKSRPQAEKDDAEIRRLTILGQLAGDDKTNPQSMLILQAAMETDPVRRKALIDQITKGAANPVAAPGAASAAGGL